MGHNQPNPLLLRNSLKFKMVLIKANQCAMLWKLLLWCCRQQSYSSSQVKIHPGCDHNKEYTALALLCYSHIHTRCYMTTSSRDGQTNGRHCAIPMLERFNVDIIKWECYFCSKIVGIADNCYQLLNLIHKFNFFVIVYYISCIHSLFGMVTSALRLSFNNWISTFW